MVLPITTVPAQVLRTKANQVNWDKKAIEISKSLAQTLMAKDNPKGVGLAAPQLSKKMRMFVTWLAQNPEAEPSPEDMLVFINPVLTATSKEMTFGPDKDDPYLEGCLSIPGLYGPVPRHEWVEVEFETVPYPQLSAANDQRPTEKRVQRFSDFAARVVQHEYDHLEGILFTDYTLQFDLPIYEFKKKKMTEIDKEILKSF